MAEAHCKKTTLLEVFFGLYAYSVVPKGVPGTWCPRYLMCVMAVGTLKVMANSIREPPHRYFVNNPSDVASSTLSTVIASRRGLACQLPLCAAMVPEMEVIDKREGSLP